MLRRAPVVFGVLCGVVALALVSVASARAQSGPSFDCSRVRLEVERAICASPWLSRLDSQMASAYRELRGLVSGADRDGLLREQRDWLGSRNVCGLSRRCLIARYEDRIARLERRLERDQSEHRGRAAGEEDIARAAPSFRCTGRRNATERRICDVPALGALDQTMHRRYQALFDQATGLRARRIIRNSQRDWIRQRNACGSGTACIRRSYKTRISELDVVSAEYRRRRGGQADLFARTAPRTGERRERARDVPGRLSRSGASFDCDAPETRADRAVCGNRRLVRLDREMSDLFESLHAATRDDRIAYRALVRSQRAWAGRRLRCGARRSCLRVVYEERVAELQSIRYSLRPGRIARARRGRVQRDRGGQALRWGRAPRCRAGRGVTGRHVCATPGLAELDSELALQYRRALKRFASARQRRRLTVMQKAWIEQRDLCGTDTACLRDAYDDRIVQLSEGDTLALQ